MKSKKGISLIVLVITIIVMIILAAAIILSLNNAGIIGNANQAVSETDYKAVQTAAQLKYADIILGESTGELFTGEYIKQQLIAEGTITIEQASMYRFRNNGEVIRLQTKAEYETLYKEELKAIEGKYTIDAEGIFTLDSSIKNTITVLAVPYGAKTIGGNTLRSSTSLEKVIMPDTIISMEHGALNGCSNLTEIIMSNNIKKFSKNDVSNTPWYNSLKEKANSGDGWIIVQGILIYADYTKLEKEILIIPNGVETIGVDTFWNWYDLKIVEIPNSVELICDSAFGLAMFSQGRCLEDVIFKGNIPELENFSFANNCGIKTETREIIDTKNPDAIADPLMD